jgi:sugar phosphate isomerase/epimerase
MTNDTTRRGFLGAAAGIAGWSMAGAVPASAKVELAPYGIRLGVASYSLRKFDRTKAIEMVKALQTPFISIKEFHLRYVSTPEELAAGRKEFESAGLKIMSGGNVDLKSPDAAVLRKSFEYAKGAGMPMMVCAPTHDNLKTLEGLVKEYNIALAIHNHGPEDKHFPSPESVLEAVKGMDKRMGLCMDIGHSVRAKSDILKATQAAGSRLLDVHVKDLGNTTDAKSQCDVGDGILPIVGLFKLLHRMNYQGCVNLEYEINADNPLPGMQRSFSYMRGVLAGLAG